jgi:hypothetical protein
VSDDGRWAVLAYIESGPRKLTQNLARSITPFQYHVLGVTVRDKHWQPKGPLDAPPPEWWWIDSRPLVGSSRGYKAIARAVRFNRRYHNRKPTSLGGRRWQVVIARERDSLSSSMTFDWRDSCGCYSLFDCGRFHVVNDRWPGVADALKGGGV